MQPVNFDTLIRYFAGAATPEDALYVEDWRIADASHAAFFDELFTAWNAEHPYSKPDIAQMWEAFNHRHHSSRKSFHPRKKRSPVWLKAAAVLALLAGATYFLFFFNKSEIHYYAAPDGAKNIILPDSTRVLLQPGSTLSYLETPKAGRRLSLKGNAALEIVNHHSPLVMDLENGLHIKDIGTRFLIEQQHRLTTITVYNGKVAAYFSADTAFASAQQIITADAASMAFSIAAIKGRFEFKDVPVNNILQQLSAHFHTSVTVKDSTLSNQRITIATGDETLEAWLDILSIQLETGYHKDEKGNIIIE